MIILHCDPAPLLTISGAPPHCPSPQSRKRGYAPAITCIALVLRLGHSTGGAHVLIWTCWGLRQPPAETRAEFQHSMAYYVTEQCQKHWKHVLMQKVVTLNTCFDIACLTFQLPHITTGSFQSDRRQPTTGSLQSVQRLRERNKPSVGLKSFAVHKLVWWHFQVGWASGLQIVFLWHNVYNQKYVWIILLKMTFLDFPRYSGYIWQARWTMCKIFVVKFSQDFTCQKSLQSGNFWQLLKNKRCIFGGTQIKYMEAILSNSTRKLVWFVITKMLIEGQRNKFIMSFIIIFGTLPFSVGCCWGYTVLVWTHGLSRWQSASVNCSAFTVYKTGWPQH